MKLTEMRQILAENQIRLTKSLGQNFLHDRNQLQRIVRAAELKETDRVLEIGPGLGPLTQLILEKGANVLALEIDRRLFDFLKQQFANNTRLSLLHVDALEYLRGMPRDWSGWKVVANLPYSVASPILVELAKAKDPPELVVGTLQVEVAQKLMATATSSDYGVITLLIQLRYTPKGWFRVPASCFFPVPEVDSACVTLQKRPDRLLSERQELVFEQVVKRSFSQRRKMMLKLLKEDWPIPRLHEAFERLGIPENARAETISLSQFAGLTEMLDAANDPSP